MIKAYLALGSNLGDRLATLREARRRLAEADGIRLLASSGLYETRPVGGPDGQPPYLNAVLEIDTRLSPAELLRLTQQIETAGGRVRQERWGARTLDIDILFYGAQLCRVPGLEIPHPRLHQRRFVLLPLADLAPLRVHPQKNRTVSELLQSLPDEGGEALLASTW